MITWAVETGIETEYELGLIDSAKKAGCQIYSPEFLPFEAGSRSEVPDFEGRVIFHGSLQGAKYAKENYDWEVYENAEHLCCKYYYPRLAPKLLNGDAIFLTYGMLNQAKDRLFREFGQDDCIFIRPDTNRKIFTGTLVQREKWNETVELIGFYDVNPEELCVVSHPVNIVSEWRFFICQGKVITGSRYRHNRKSVRELATAEDTRDAQSFVDFATTQGYNPDPIWVMDMCETKAGRRCILEVGSFSSSGLYAANTDKIVEAVNDLVC